jgi:DNA-binding MarR family transcriptional regulator
MLDAETLSRIRIVLAKTARELNSTATGEGLTPTQASVLGLVYSRGPLGVSELIELEGLNPTMLSRILSRLSHLQLVRRYPDPDDLRAVTIEATAEGRRLAQRLRSRRTQALGDCLERLPEATVVSIIAALPGLEALAGELRYRDQKPT